MSTKAVLNMSISVLGSDRTDTHMFNGALVVCRFLNVLNDVGSFHTPFTQHMVENSARCKGINATDVSLLSTSMSMRNVQSIDG